MFNGKIHYVYGHFSVAMFDITRGYPNRKPPVDFGSSNAPIKASHAIRDGGPSPGRKLRFQRCFMFLHRSNPSTSGGNPTFEIEVLTFEMSDFTKRRKKKSTPIRSCRPHSQQILLLHNVMTFPQIHGWKRNETSGWQRIQHPQVDHFDGYEKWQTCKLT